MLQSPLASLQKRDIIISLHMNLNVNIPEPRALSRKDFAAMDDKTLLTA
jgi:hypothetical protein